MTLNRPDRTAPVLVLDDTDGLSRSALAAVRGLAAAGYRPVVGRRPAQVSVAAASRDCAGTINIPESTPEAYARALAARDWLAVFPQGDYALRMMRHPGHEWVDKTVLAQRGLDAGVAPPGTRIFASVAAMQAQADSLNYPLIAKPQFNISKPLTRATRCDGPDDIRALRETGEGYTTQDFLEGEMRYVSGVIHEGALLAAMHVRYLRTWPLEYGISCASVTVAPEPAAEERIRRLLGDYSGIFQVQMLGGYPIDVNPRIHGSLALAIGAGANLPAIVCDIARGAPPAPVRAREGVYYRWLEGDLRHACARLRRREIGPGAALAQLRPRRGTAHGIESLRDPAPLLERARYAWRKRMKGRLS